MRKLATAAATVVISTSILLSTTGAVVSQERTSTLSLERERQATLEEFDITEVPSLDAVRAIAIDLFALPVEQQNAEQLKALATEANRTANLVDYIYDEYDDYYRDNYRYEFVQKKVIEAASEYGKVFNDFLSIRNQAYFNLGLLSRNAGRTMEAFLYFKDAFRLSSFDCGQNTPKTSCMRWKAEQELQKLLGLSHIKAYVTW